MWRIFWHRSKKRYYFALTQSSIHYKEELCLTTWMKLLLNASFLWRLLLRYEDKTETCLENDLSGTLGEILICSWFFPEIVLLEFRNTQTEEAHSSQFEDGFCDSRMSCFLTSMAMHDSFGCRDRFFSLLSISVRSWSWHLFLLFI